MALNLLKRLVAKTHTTVQVSMQSTRGSEVMYRESDSAYSFHSWPKNDWTPAMRWWCRTKYPSKKTWMDPAGEVRIRVSQGFVF